MSEERLAPLNLPPTLPAPFVRNIRAAYSENGSAWLLRLPDILGDFADRWSLTLHAPFPNLTFNYVAPVTLADGSEAVFKAGVPHKDRTAEIETLRFYNGDGLARPLQADTAAGVCLIERLRPGETITAWANERTDERAMHAACDVIGKLGKPLPAAHSFPTIAEWAEGLKDLRTRFGGGTGPFPPALVEEAETLWRELLASSEPPVLLHADLHHDNILTAGTDGFVGIDPHGVAGEYAYETGSILRNLWPNHHTIAEPRKLLARRMDQFADELPFPRTRIRDWAVAQAVLSAWWCVESDADDAAESIQTAALLASLP